MVDSNTSSNNFSKSLSADSELQSAYEYLKNGDYKQCKRTIDKKLQKLKNKQDIINFNIVKLILYKRTKKVREAKKLLESIRKEVLENSNLLYNTDLINYFINVLRDINEDQIAYEIYKNYIQNIKLPTLNKTEQNKMMRELVMNFEFNDLYQKINVFLKNENESDIKFLTLLKYEVIYIICFKLEKLPKSIANNTLKDMLNNYDRMSKEKGFTDILIKYLMKTNDSTNFLKLFENNTAEFTNAPTEDILIDIYYKNGESLQLINYLMSSIKKNLHTWNFINYQRLVHYTFFTLNKLDLLNKIDYAAFASSPVHTDFDYDVTTLLTYDNPNDVLSIIYTFFDTIQNKVADRKTNFNAIKGAIIAKLLILHFVIINFKVYDSVSPLIYELLVELLDNIVTKQSVLFEINKFYIYLTQEHREKLLSRFEFTKVADNSDDADKERLIFFYKLEKMLIKDDLSLDQVVDKISVLAKNYFFLLDKTEKKLEKGERLINDDLIILINEYFFDYYKRNKNETNEDFISLAYTIYSLDSIAHTKSPYNYDISIFFLRISGLLNMNNKVLEILKYMNLKGPQFETVSYLAFPFFFNSYYKPGLLFLIENLEKWQKENKSSVKKTLWKMFTGRNFWNTEELLMFLTENDNSYYKFVLNSIDYLNNVNDIILNKNNDNNYSENITESAELLNNYILDLEKRSKNIIRNQDIIVSLAKYKSVDFFNSDYSILSENINYKANNYRFEIDSILKDNILYVHQPGFKNNYLETNEVEVFGIFDKSEILPILIQNKLAFSTLSEEKIFNSGILNHIHQIDQYLVNSKSLKIENVNNEADKFILDLERTNRVLLEIYLDCQKNIQNITEDEESLIKNYEYLRSYVVDELSNQRKEYFKDLLNFQAKRLFFNRFHVFNRLFLESFVGITVKFMDLINANKKNLKENGNQIKTQIVNNFKNPILSLYNETIEALDSVSFNSEAVSAFWKTFSVLKDEELLKMFIEEKPMLTEVLNRIADEHKSLCLETKEAAKNMKTYFRENI
jgi:hypothetical protein